MTNLHLGGARGDLAAVADAAGRPLAAGAGDLRAGRGLLPGHACASASTCCSALGWRRFAVGEVNAFGDLLPG